MYGILASAMGLLFTVVGGLLAYGVVVALLIGTLSARRDREGRPLSAGTRWSLGVAAAMIPLAALAVAIGILLSLPTPDEKAAQQRAQVSAFCANWRHPLVQQTVTAPAVALTSDEAAKPWLVSAIRDRWETCAKSSVRRADGVAQCDDATASPEPPGQIPSYRVTATDASSLRVDRGNGDVVSIRRMTVRIEDREGAVVGSTSVYVQPESGVYRHLCPAEASSLSDLMVLVFPRAETQ